MENFVVEFFSNFNRIITSLHVFSMALMIGSLFCISFVVKPVIYEIKIPIDRYGKSLGILRRFLFFVWICIFVMIVTGVIYGYEHEFSKGNPITYITVNALKMFWIFMILNFIYVFFKYKEAKRYFKSREYVQTHENLELIFTYMLPLNFLLSLVCAYLGMLIKGC